MMGADVDEGLQEILFSNNRGIISIAQERSDCRFVWLVATRYDVSVELYPAS
jgi:hypothetical protein